MHIKMRERTYVIRTNIIEIHVFNRHNYKHV